MLTNMILCWIMTNLIIYVFYKSEKNWSEDVSCLARLDVVQLCGMFSFSFCLFPPLSSWWFHTSYFFSNNICPLHMKNLGGWLKQMIRKELAIQLEGKLKCLSSYGMKPTYIDLHFNYCEHILLLLFKSTCFHLTLDTPSGP